MGRSEFFGSRIGRATLLVWAVLVAVLGTGVWSSWPSAGLEFFRPVPGAEPWSVRGVAGAALGHGIALLELFVMVATVEALGAGAAAILRVGDWGVKAALGFGVASLLHEGSGFAGLFRAPVMHLEALGATVIALRQWRKVPRLIREVRMRGHGIPAAIVGVLVAAAFLLTRFPETHEDPRVYHFAAPEFYLDAGRIVTQPWIYLWQMPLGAEMVFLLPFSVGGLEAGKLAVLASVLVGGRLVALLADRLAPGGRAGWWGAAMYGCCGLVLSQIGYGKNDVLLGMYVTGALVAFLGGVGGRLGSLLTGMAFLGMALAVKWTSVLPVVGCLVVAYGRYRRHLTGRQLALSGSALIGPACGWWARAWLTTGNVFHPFASSVFPDLGWGPEFEVALWAYARRVGPVRRPVLLDAMVSPLRAIGRSDVGSPLLAFWAPVAWLSLRAGPVRPLGQALAAGFVAWLFTERTDRFLFPFFPVVAAICAAGAGTVAVPFDRVVRCALTALSVVAALAHAGQAVGAGGSQALSGRIAATERLQAAYTTWMDASRSARWSRAPRSRIYLIGETRRLGFAPWTIGQETLGVQLPWKLSHESGSVAEMAKRFRQAGITEVYYNFLSADYRAHRFFAGPPWTERALGLYASFARNHLHTIYRPPRVDVLNGGFYGYQVLWRPAAVPELVPFLPGAERVAVEVTREAALERGATTALTRLNRLVDTTPGILQFIALRGQVAFTLGHWADAYRDLEYAIRRGFIGDYTSGFAAAAAINMRRLDLAGTMVERSLVVYPTQREAVRLLQACVRAFRAERTSREGREAARAMVSEARGAMAMTSNQPSLVRLCAARVLRRAGQVEEALRILEQLRRELPRGSDLDLECAGELAACRRERRGG